MFDRPPGKPPKWDKNKQYFPPVDNSIDKVDSNSEKVIDVLIQNLVTRLDSTYLLIKKKNKGRRIRKNISMNIQSNLINMCLSDIIRS